MVGRCQIEIRSKTVETVTAAEHSGGLARSLVRRSVRSVTHGKPEAVPKSLAHGERGGGAGVEGPAVELLPSGEPDGVGAVDAAGGHRDGAWGRLSSG